MIVVSKQESVLKRPGPSPIWPKGLAQGIRYALRQVHHQAAGSPGRGPEPRRSARTTSTSSPSTCCSALLNQEEGVAGLVAKAGGNPQRAQAGPDPGRSRGCRRSKARRARCTSRATSRNLLNVADKEAQKRGDQYIASELFLLACAADKGEAGGSEAVRN